MNSQVEHTVHVHVSQDKMVTPRVPKICCAIDPVLFHFVIESVRDYTHIPLRYIRSQIACMYACIYTCITHIWLVV